MELSPLIAFIIFPVVVILITTFATLSILSSVPVLNEHVQLIVYFVVVFYGVFYGAKTRCYTARSFGLVCGFLSGPFCGFLGQLILL